MFGFPIPLYDRSSPIKMTTDADSGFIKPAIRETFYSIKDGNWTDTTVWQTASGRVGKLPSANDDVYIRHTIGGTFSPTINNLFITPLGTLNGNGGGSAPLIVLGNLQSYGTFNYSPNSTSGGNSITLCGVNNYIDKTKQTATVIRYGGTISQPIIDANYSVLGVVVGARGEKYLTCDLTVGAFDAINQGTTSWVNLKGFNFTCNGTLNTTNSISIYCDGNGYLLFKGACTFAGGFYCTQSPTIEFQNGVTLGYGNYANWNTPYQLGSAAMSYLGTGQLKFTTNNQTIFGSYGTYYLDNTILIDNNIVLTTTFSTSATLILKNVINGGNASSTLLQSASSIINYQSATQPMITGILDTSTNLNTWIYGLNNQDIKGGPTTLAKQVYRNLTLNGTGVKTLQGYVSVQNTYTLTSPATLALNGYTLTNP